MVHKYHSHIKMSTAGRTLLICALTRGVKHIHDAVLCTVAILSLKPSYANDIYINICLYFNESAMANSWSYGRIKGIISMHMSIIFFLRYTQLVVCNILHMLFHYDDVIMGAIASQITSITIFYSIVYSDIDKRKHQSSASLAFVRGIHRGPVNSSHKWPVTRKMFPFDDVIMLFSIGHKCTRSKRSQICHGPSHT